jgi:hypothetical protein
MGATLKKAVLEDGKEYNFKIYGELQHQYFMNTIVTNLLFPRFTFGKHIHYTIVARVNVIFPTMRFHMFDGHVIFHIVKHKAHLFQ